MGIFGGYTRDQLNDQYDQQKACPTAPQEIGLYRTNSDAVKARVKGTHNIAYGSRPEETLDVYPAAAPNAPVHVFIHGGAWRGNHKDDSIFPAEGFVAAGVTYVPINFDLATAVSLDEMVRQARAAIAWVWKNITQHGGDPNRITISGHSSGAHMAAMCLCTDWAEFGAPSDTVKGAFLLSGAYDLEPVRQTVRNDYLHLDLAAEHRLSPIRHLGLAPAIPLMLAHGEFETAEFTRHSRELARAWIALGRTCRYWCVPGENHFSVAHHLGNPAHPVGQAIIALAKGSVW